MHTLSFYRLGVVVCVILELGSGACRKKEKRVDKTVPPIASLRQTTGSVHARRAEALTWITAKEGLSLYYRDAIKTSEKASARVAFKAGNSLDIEEQSLVIIEAPRTPSPFPETSPLPAIAHVKEGAVRGITKPGAPPLQLVAPSGQTAHITAEGKDEVPFRVRLRPGGKMEIAILQGMAVIHSGKQKVRVKQKEVVDITAKSISAPVPLLPYPELESPNVDEKFHAGSRVSLKWRAIDQAALYHVQVSGEINFASRIADETVAAIELSLAGPQPGKTYVWRVSSIDAAGHEGEFGFARRFHVITAKPPPEERLIAPANNAGLQYAGKPIPITFRWQGEGPLFELVIAKTPRLAGKVHLRRRTKTSSITISSLTSGVYYWSVYVQTPQGMRPLRDKSRRLIIAQRLPPGVNVPNTIDWK